MNRALVLKSPGFAGIGDLLLALELAVLVAQATGRSLVVDWRDTPYCRGGLDLAEQLFAVRGVKSLPYGVLADASGTVQPSAWLGQLDQPLRQVYSGLHIENWDRAWARTNLDAGIAALDSDASWLVLWDHSSSELKAAALRRLGLSAPPPLSHHLIPLPALEEAITSYERQYIYRPTIGLHLRASAEGVRAGKSADLKRVYERLDQLLEVDPGSCLFVASDNAAAIAAIEARYPSVVTRPKWLPVADAPLHLSEDSNPPGLAIASDALVELALLAACDHLIHPASSSFSLAAARWGGIPRERLHPIAPPLSLPGCGHRAHWLRSLVIVIGQAPRLLTRSPLGFCLLVMRISMQPVSTCWMLLRRRLALGDRWRRLRAAFRPG